MNAGRGNTDPSSVAGVPVCRNCRSLHTRRSRPHNALERFLRDSTALRFHVCAECGARGYHLGRRSSEDRETVVTHVEAPPAHPSTRRWHRNQRRQRARVVRTLLFAALLGIAVAALFQRCQGAAESSFVSR